MPLLSPEQIAFLEGPNTLAIATQDGNLVPEAARALNLRHLGDNRVAVWLASGVVGRTQQNLTREPRIAVAVSRPSSHQTFQLKGRAVSVKLAGPEARATIEQAFAAFLQEAAAVGLPARLLQPVVLWPALEIVVEVSEIYDQTPGPGAGDRCPS